MSTKRSLTMLVVSAMVIMTSVIVFAAIARTLPTPPTSAYAPGEVQRSMPVQDTEIVRWAAMGEAYAKAEQLIQRARDVSATRVQDAEIVRWAAMGEAFARAEQLIQRAHDVNATRVQDAEIVRWAAMGEAYARAEQLIQRARDVNATR